MTVIGLTIRETIPVWLLVLVVTRDVLLFLLLPSLKKLNLKALPVTYIGKAATFCLLYAFPLLLLAEFDVVVAQTAYILGWILAILGVVLYWASGFWYFKTARDLLRKQQEKVATSNG